MTEEPIKYVKPIGPKHITEQIEKEIKEHTDNKKNEYKLHQESSNWTIEQKQEMFSLFFSYLEDRFGHPFCESVLTANSNFYSNSYLLKCHKFLKCLKLENIYYPKSHFRYTPYGEYSCVVYLNDFDFIEFMMVGTKTTTIRFSFDVVGNTFTLKYPYPLAGDSKEFEKPDIKEGNVVKVKSGEEKMIDEGKRDEGKN